MGARKAPFYRVVVADSRYPRDGRFIGKKSAHITQWLTLTLKSRLMQKKAKKWITMAQPTDTVKSILKKEGIL